MPTTSVRRFLATTALPAFWDTTQPMLMLGEWCRPYAKKALWEAVDAEVFEHPSLPALNSEASFKITVRVYDELLPLLADWMNHAHHAQHSLRYWQILLGPFLLFYIQSVYIRYHYLKAAFANNPILETIGLAESSYHTPINTHEFCMLAADSDVWNLQLFTQLLPYVTTHTFPTQPGDWSQELKNRQERYGEAPAYRAMTRLKIKCVEWLANLRKRNIVGLFGFEHELSRANWRKLILHSKFRIMPLKPIRKAEKGALQLVALNQPLRQTLADLPANDELARLVLQTLPVNLPMNLVECYQDEKALSQICFPYQPGSMMGGWLLNDRFKFWGAGQAEQGSKVIAMQHGGGYGAWQYSCYEYLERQNSDAFVSWGWSDGPDVKAAPSVFINERNAERQARRDPSKPNNMILWPVTEFERFPPYIASNHLNRPSLYYDWQQRFTQSLQPQAMEQILVRIRPGSQTFAYFQDTMKSVKLYFSTEKSTFFEQLDETKILIGDNLNTTFHYGLVFNIPTLLFWDPLLWTVRDNAAPYFKALKDAGIYHDTPESAAHMLNEIVTNPLVWWHRADVQQARAQFCKYYTKMSKQWVKELSHVLVSV